MLNRHVDLSIVVRYDASTSGISKWPFNCKRVSAGFLPGAHANVRQLHRLPCVLVRDATRALENMRGEKSNCRFEVFFFWFSLRFARFIASVYSCSRTNRPIAPVLPSTVHTHQTVQIGSVRKRFIFLFTQCCGSRFLRRVRAKNNSSTTVVSHGDDNENTHSYIWWNDAVLTHTHTHAHVRWWTSESYK